ncbi:MAG: trigger factor family protein, partial [Planctomycetaceae bacterium]
MAVNEDTSLDQEAVDDGEFRMSLTVAIDDVGPCKKHVRVTVPQSDIEHYYGEAVGEMIDTADVPGFRQGRAPRKLVERRFREELMGQVKQKILVESLEQVAEDNDLDPIN